ncbi:hypothetical protein QTP88_004495 [Uroleucon formosanum]
MTYPVTDVVVMLLETPFRRWNSDSKNDLLKMGKPIPILSALAPDKKLNKSELIERFLGFHNASEDPTAQGLFNLVNSVLHKFDTENKLVGLCYDGACVMSGHLTGLQARVKEVAPNALFTHCLAHRLNLVLQHGCSINAKCRIFFANLTGIAAYFHNSTSRTNFVDTIVGKRIPQFVQTRWSSRSKILHTIVNECITTKGGAAKEREKKRIKLNVAAKSCQNIQHFFMPINKINEHDIDDPTSVSNLIMCPAKFKPNLKVVTSSDNQVIESENTSQENDTTNLEVITSSDAQVTVSSIDIHDPIHPSSLTHLNLKERILKGGYKPILSLYPRKLQGHKFRSFHKEWYKQYDWLEYSPTADAAFCFSCRMFKAQDIFNSLCSVLDLMNKHWEDVLSVCFDGASTMSGHLNGVQSKCKEKNNSIMYVHCYAHCLNLVLVDSICEKSNSKGKQNRLIFNFLGTVQFIYNFIENSPMRHATLEKVAKETGDKLHTLKSCSNIRWACRAEAVKAIMNNYEVLIIAIENICENCPVPEMRAKGIGLLYQLKTFDFIFGMYMMNPILMLILKVSTLLQEPNLNLVLAMKNVNSLRSTLDNSNSRKVSTRLDSNSSNQAFFNTKFDELKITVFYPLLDKLLSGIDLRFKQDTFDLVDAIACMLNMNLTQKTTKILSTFSKVSEDELITELKLLKNYENAMQLNGASSKSIYEWIDWLKTTGNSTVYTCVFKTLKMFTIIPVTSCTCERVFSKLTIVKNKLRSTMSQERLESL